MSNWFDAGVTGLQSLGGFFGQKARMRHQKEMFNRYVNRQSDLLEKLHNSTYNDAFSNRSLALSGLMGSNNPWGSSTYSYAPSGQTLNGMPLQSATLQQSLSPAAQQLFNKILNQAQTNNIGGVQLQPDSNYLSRNINRATPRWAQAKGNLERSLIQSGISPNSEQWQQAQRNLAQQQADERLNFEDKAFTNDMDYQKHYLGNQGNALQQLLQIQPPNPAGALGGIPVDSSKGYLAALGVNQGNLGHEQQIAQSAGQGWNEVLAPLTNLASNWYNQRQQQQNNDNMLAQLKVLMGKK